MAKYREFKGGPYCITVEHYPTCNLRGPWVVRFFSNFDENKNIDIDDLASYKVETRNYFTEEIAHKEARMWLRVRGYLYHIDWVWKDADEGAKI